MADTRLYTRDEMWGWANPNERGNARVAASVARLMLPEHRTPYLLGLPARVREAAEVLLRANNVNPYELPAFVTVDVAGPQHGERPWSTDVSAGLFGR